MGAAYPPAAPCCVVRCSLLAWTSNCVLSGDEVIDVVLEVGGEGRCGIEARDGQVGRVL